MNKVLEEISKIGILPVVVLDDAKDAKPLAKALCAGGLPCAEVTFRTAAAKESIARRSIYTNEIHSNRWNQCEQYERLLRIRPYLSHWW